MASSNGTDFSRSTYEALISTLTRQGYAVRQFADADPAEPHLILRHDLDMSLDAALPIAEVESALGTQATYFILLRSEFYNPLTVASKAVFARLVGLGHSIGLHFDASLYSCRRDALEEAAARECAILEDIVGQSVRTISFHRPAPDLLGKEQFFAGRLHAYAPRFFNDMGYCSDSRGAWHHGHPLDHPAVAQRRALQLLTHPIWWWGLAAGGVQDILDAFLISRTRHIRHHLALNCQPYSEATPLVATLKGAHRSTP